MKTLLSVLTLAATLTIASAQQYSVTLDPQQEADPIGTRTGIGSGILTLAGNVLSIDVTFSGLSGFFSADHIHGPALPTPQTPAGVLYGLQSITTLSDNNHAGRILGDVTLVAGPGGFTLEQQLDQLNSGLWYINIHTTPNFAGGEIRGQIYLVPEPSTLALAGVALVAGLAGLIRRRR